MALVYKWIADGGQGLGLTPGSFRDMTMAKVRAVAGVDHTKYLQEGKSTKVVFVPFTDSRWGLGGSSEEIYFQICYIT